MRGEGTVGWHQNRLRVTKSLTDEMTKMRLGNKVVLLSGESHRDMRQMDRVALTVLRGETILGGDSENEL